VGNNTEVRILLIGKQSQAREISTQALQTTIFRLYTRNLIISNVDRFGQGKNNKPKLRFTLIKY